MDFGQNISLNLGISAYFLALLSSVLKVLNKLMGFLEVKVLLDNQSLRTINLLTNFADLCFFLSRKGRYI